MDQSGINLEVVSGRTLDFKGEKRILAMAQRPQQAHHSYSILPVISINGHLYPKLVVCFREPKPPMKFDRELAPFENLICYHSKSGMFNSELMVKFMKIFCKDETIEPGSLILMDAWGGNNQAAVFAENTMIVCRIPKKTTKYTQPEDLFFNRQFKSFLRKASDKIRMFHAEFKLAVRKNIASLLSLTMYQFSSGRFGPFLRFSWYKGGYVDEKDTFMTPPDFCFDIDPLDRKCEIETSADCLNEAFIICAHCEKAVCMEHCIVEQHRCE